MFSLHYHLVLVTKHRRKVIDDRISDKLRRMFSSIGETYKVTVEEWNHDKDHVHVMFWSRSFCLLTTGGASIDTIREYIQGQGHNNR